MSLAVARRGCDEPGVGRLVLVDGTFELFRGFFGAPSKTSAAGRELGAALAVARSMRSLAKQKGVTHIALAFDSEIESFRNQLFPGYKTGEGMDPQLFAQFPIVEDLCEALGFAVFRMHEFEADDALAALAARFQDDAELEQIVIASPDKDLTQCVVGSRVVTWDRIRDRTFDSAGVVERLGVRPEQVPDYLALVGDSADGIPGIPRWGAKSASQVLSVYAHLEDIPERAEEFLVPVRGKAVLHENLRQRWQDALLYRTLATLRRDVPLSVRLAELEPGPVDAQLLSEIAERYQAPELQAAFAERG